MGFTRLLRSLCRDENIGRRVVPIIPDEARTFGMDALFRELEIYASQGQKYEPVDHDLLLSYSEDSDGQILEEGITEAGSLASFIAAGSSYAPRRAHDSVLHLLLNVRIPTGWGSHLAGRRCSCPGISHGRDRWPHHTARRGLQHQDGHSLVLASTVPAVQAYDPAFAFELGAIVKDGIDRMYGPDTPETERDVIYYITLYNENYPMPALPDHPETSAEFERGAVRGLYRWRPAPQGKAHSATIVFSGISHQAATIAANELANHYDVAAELWSATSYKRLREQALEVERSNRLHPSAPQEEPLVTQLLNDSSGPITAVSDFMRAVPEQILPFVPEGRRFSVLGTDGMGRSDTREALRRYFEVDAGHIVVSTLSALLNDGKVSADVVEDAIKRYDIDSDAPNPYVV